MMRHHSALALGLSFLFVLPAAVPGAQEPLDLGDRLEATVAALEHLAGIERRVQAGDDSVLGELLVATEAPLPDAAQRDQTLNVLRAEVSALQERWDEISFSGSPLAAPGAGPLPLPTDAQPARPTTTHTGLDDEARRAIAVGLERPRRGDDAPRDTVDLRSFEESEGYTADALRHGRLLCRSGRWAEALERLVGLDSPEARYWAARCYEGLGRDREAIDLFQALVDAGQPDETGAEADPETHAFARRARYDLQFISLRRELAEQRRSTKGSEEDAR